jgi:hypothetical protein
MVERARRPRACADPRTWIARDGASYERIVLHRQPVPDRDYVIHLTNLEPA